MINTLRGLFREIKLLYNAVMIDAEFFRNSENFLFIIFYI